MDGNILASVNRLRQYCTLPIKNWMQHLVHECGQCIICNRSAPEHATLCAFCFANLPLFNMAKVEGDLLNWPALDQLFSKRYFDDLISVGPYTWPLSDWIHQFKYQRRHDFVSLLAFLLDHQWRQSLPHHNKPDLVLSVPIHIAKWQLRSFNQAHLLAKEFVDNSPLHYQPSVIARTRSNTSQVGLTGAKRRRNIKGHFLISTPEKVVNQHVLLIDDVLTTGATVNEISRLLKIAGAKHVTVMTLCISLDKCT